MIQSLRSRFASGNSHRILEHLIQALTKEAGHTLRMRDARDGFTSVLRQVRKGNIQVIGMKPRMDVLRALPDYDPPKKRIAFAERSRSREYTSAPRSRRR